MTVWFSTDNDTQQTKRVAAKKRDTIFPFVFTQIVTQLLHTTWPTKYYRQTVIVSLEQRRVTSRAKDRDRVATKHWATAKHVTCKENRQVTDETLLLKNFMRMTLCETTKSYCHVVKQP